ncbi:MAG: two-component regulator propeller domain-containing protein [Bacteroidota bacterium]
MKKENIYRYPYIAVGSLVFAALIGLGYNNILNIRSNEIGIPAKTFFAAIIDNANNKWFLTELGIISFNGEKWTLHNENNKVALKDMKDFAYAVNTDGPELWIASPNGATVARLPINAGSDATTYHTENAAILSNNVVKVTIGKSPLRWFGTDKGVSAFSGNNWLTPSYEEMYPGMIFEEYPITSMATNRDGDSLYVGTRGAGVARVFRNEVDGISGASVYAQWGPIILPSDNICSIYIASDGAKWFGTDKGIAKHIGNNTLENWTVFTTDDGLVDNFVQAITADKKGNFWFGTRGGVSVFNGSEWTSYTTDNGLNSNNILCLAVDRDGVVWIGTDDGVTCYNDGEFISYK